VGHRLASVKGLEIRFAESMQTRFGVDLRGGDALVPEELLDMIEGHASVEEDRRNAGAQTVWRHLLRDSGLDGRFMHNQLDVARRVLVAPITLEHIAAAAPPQVRLQFLGKGRYDGHIPIAAATACCITQRRSTFGDRVTGCARNGRRASSTI